MSTIDICPACGYPKLGGGLCAYCLSLQAVADEQTSVGCSGTARFSPSASIEESREELGAAVSP
jgi:hypothetical protein